MMEKKDKIEIFFGGAMGIVAIIAAIVEHCSGSNIAGCIKDVSSTLVVVAILFASIKFPSFKLKTRLENAVESWGENNAPLIMKAINWVATDDKKQGFKILQNQEDFTDRIVAPLNKDGEDWVKLADYSNKKTGRFIAMPSYEDMIANNFKVTIYTNQSHFEKLDNFDKNYSKLIDAIKVRYPECEVKPSSQHIMELSFKKISNRDDIIKFVNVLDFVMSVIKVIM